jgi:hypothetical protein
MQHWFKVWPVLMYTCSTWMMLMIQSTVKGVKIVSVTLELRVMLYSSLQWPRPMW